MRYVLYVQIFASSNGEKVLWISIFENFESTTKRERERERERASYFLYHERKFAARRNLPEGAIPSIADNWRSRNWYRHCESGDGNVHTYRGSLGRKPVYGFRLE